MQLNQDCQILSAQTVLPYHQFLSYERNQCHTVDTEYNRTKLGYSNSNSKKQKLNCFRSEGKTCAESTE